MNVTFLNSSANFSAIMYNERKVANGVANLIEAANFGYLGQMSIKGANDYLRYLTKWSKKNTQIKKPQFHVSISCKGNMNTEEELLAAAKEWLSKMGYDGIPTLFYFHGDTNNNHIHIVTSRVDKNGQKVDHNNEIYRGRAIINEISRRDIKNIARTDFANALQYKYLNHKQFEAVLNSMGYNTTVKDGNMELTKEGQKVLSKPVELIDWRGKRNLNDTQIFNKRKIQLKAIFHKYKAGMDTDTFVSLMKSKFGVDVVFFGDKKKPYGYIVIDHAMKGVYKGGDIMPLKALLEGKGNKEKVIKTLIAGIMDAEPLSTVAQINAELRKHGIYLKEGSVYLKMSKSVLYELTPEEKQQLKYNYKVEKINRYNVDSAEKADILAKFYSVDVNDIKIKPGGTSAESDKEAYKVLVEEAFRTNSPYAFLQDNNCVLISGEQDEKYILNPESAEIFSLNELDVHIGQEQYMSFRGNVQEEESNIVQVISDILFDTKGRGVGGGAANNELPKKRKKWGS